LITTLLSGIFQLSLGCRSNAGLSVISIIIFHVHKCTCCPLKIVFKFSLASCHRTLSGRSSEFSTQFPDCACRACAICVNRMTQFAMWSSAPFPYPKLGVWEPGWLSAGRSYPIYKGVCLLLPG